MTCEFENPLILKQGNPGEFELIPFDQYDDSVNSTDTVLWKNLNCPDSADAGFNSIIEKNDKEVFYKESVTTGDFLVASIGLFIFVILFIDLIERRLLPRFVRFWK